MAGSVSSDGSCFGFQPIHNQYPSLDSLRLELGFMNWTVLKLGSRYLFLNCCVKGCAKCLRLWTGSEK